MEGEVVEGDVVIIISCSVAGHRCLLRYPPLQVPIVPRLDWRDADEFVDSLDHPRHAGEEVVLLHVCSVAAHVAPVADFARGDEVSGFLKVTIFKDLQLL